MANQYTNSDYLRCYLTGAITTGDPQNDSFMSLGNARSSFQVESLTPTLINAMSQITIHQASSANGEGTGFLYADTTGSLVWTPPDGLSGTSVTISNGETKLIEGLDTEKYVLVTRNDTTDLSGTTTVQFRIKPDNLFDEVTETGVVDFRCVVLKNETASEVRNIVIWADNDEIDLGIDLTGQVDNTGRSDLHVPEGVSFGHYNGLYNVEYSYVPVTVTDGTFTPDLTGWSNDGSWQALSGGAAIDSGGGGNLYQTVTFTSGNTYRLTVDSQVVSGSLIPSLGGTAGTALGTGLAATQEIVAGNSNSYLAFTATSLFGGIDNVLLDEKVAAITDNRLHIGSMSAGEEVFIWIRRTVAPDSGVSLSRINTLRWEYAL